MPASVIDVSNSGEEETGGSSLAQRKQARINGANTSKKRASGTTSGPAGTSQNNAKKRRVSEPTVVPAAAKAKKSKQKAEIKVVERSFPRVDMFVGDEEVRVTDGRLEAFNCGGRVFESYGESILDLMQEFEDALDGVEGDAAALAF